MVCALAIRTVRMASAWHAQASRFHPSDHRLMSFTLPPSKLPNVGTTIFTQMSQLAAEHGALNLGQGFPDFALPDFLQQALVQAMREGHHQYAPMTGVAALRE